MTFHRPLGRLVLTVFWVATMGLGLCGLSGCATTKGDSAQDKRAYSLQMSSDTLDAFYAEDPGLQSKVKQAAGYGVFSNIGTNLIFVSTGGGYGVVHNNKTGEKTYMKMGEVGVGLGLGVKDFRALFVFDDQKVLAKFIDSGWEFGGEADAAAKAGDQGGEASGSGNLHSGIAVYQLTENGLALSATVSGTKYWVDDDLN